MSSPQPSLPIPPEAQVLQIGSGYWLSRALTVAAQLGIADLLKHGPKSSDDLAAATSTNADVLYRLLRALASVGIFAETQSRKFAQTQASETLRVDVPNSTRALVIFLGDHLHWKVYEQMLYSVQTGKPAFEHAIGQNVFDYFGQHPEDACVFDAAMTSHSALAGVAVAEAYDLSTSKSVMDIGGGQGYLLAAILAKYPQPLGILFDMPHVIDGARSGGLLPAGRCELVAGSFFESIPAGADVYLTKHVIHDWDDEHTLQILKNCRNAMSPDSKFLIIEQIISPGNEPSFAKLLDLEVLLYAGGRERTEEEYRHLLAASGLRLTRVIPTRSSVSVIESVPA